MIFLFDRIDEKRPAIYCRLAIITMHTRPQTSWPQRPVVFVDASDRAMGASSVINAFPKAFLAHPLGINLVLAHHKPAIGAAIAAPRMVLG